MTRTRVAVLALLVACLGAYLYWWELPKVEREAAERQVVDLARDDVVRLEITFPDRTLTLVREGDAWRLTGTLEAPADGAQVGSILTSLTSAKVTRTLDDVPADPGTFGLGEDAPHVRLTGADGETAAITIGRTTPIGSKTYLRLGDSELVHLTESNLRSIVDKQPKDLRDKQLVAFEDAAVTRVEIVGRGAEPVVLTRRDTDAWTVTPGDHVADLTEVRSYLSSLRATRAVDFTDDTPADLTTYGLAEPRLRVSVFTTEGGDDPVAALLVGDEFEDGGSKRLHAKRDAAPGVVALGEWSLRSLDKDVDAFRDKTVLRFDTDRVGRFTLERAAADAIVFTRDETGWSFEGGTSDDVDQPTVTRFLRDLRDLKGSGIAGEPVEDLAAFGLDAPAVRVTLVDTDGAEMGAITASKQGESHYATLVGSDVVYETRDYMYTRLDKARSAFERITTDDDTAARGS